MDFLRRRVSPAQEAFAIGWLFGMGFLMVVFWLMGVTCR